MPLNGTPRRERPLTTEADGTLGPTATLDNKFYQMCLEGIVSWQEELKAKGEEFEKKFAEKMPQTDDLTLIVLKGHLLIEE